MRGGRVAAFRIGDGKSAPYNEPTQNVVMPGVSLAVLQAKPPSGFVFGRFLRSRCRAKRIAENCKSDLPLQKAFRNAG
jgi:hypothetical protein